MNAFNKLTKLTSKKGMSLPELITVVVLIAIIGAAAISYVASAVSEANKAAVTSNCRAIEGYVSQALALGVPSGATGLNLPTSGSALTSITTWQNGTCKAGNMPLIFAVPSTGFTVGNYKPTWTANGQVSVAATVVDTP